MLEHSITRLINNRGFECVEKEGVRKRRELEREK